MEEGGRGRARDSLGWGVITLEVLKTRVIFLSSSVSLANPRFLPRELPHAYINIVKHPRSTQYIECVLGKDRNPNSEGVGTGVTPENC